LEPAPLTGITEGGIPRIVLIAHPRGGCGEAANGGADPLHDLCAPAVEGHIDAAEPCSGNRLEAQQCAGIGNASDADLGDAIGGRAGPAQPYRAELVVLQVDGGMPDDELIVEHSPAADCAGSVEQ